jgi:hypothetical protein
VLTDASAREALAAHAKDVYALLVWRSTLVRRDGRRRRATIILHSHAPAPPQVTGGGDALLKLWELPSLRPAAAQLPRDRMHSGAVYAAALCAGDKLATASQDAI